MENEPYMESFDKLPRSCETLITSIIADKYNVNTELTGKGDSQKPLFDQPTPCFAVMGTYEKPHIKQGHFFGNSDYTFYFREVKGKTKTVKIKI